MSPFTWRWSPRREHLAGSYTNCEGWELRAHADSLALVTLQLSDDDFAKLVSGKTQAQRLFMSGKLKVKGDVMKVAYVIFLS